MSFDCDRPTTSQAPYVLVVAVALGLGAGLLPRRAAAQSFPQVPHVDNLTEGFRIEAAFSSIAVAPSDPNYVYLGTSRGRVYTSSDGGETWVDHDLVEFPRRSEFPLKPRPGMSLGMHNFLKAQPQEAPNTFLVKRFASPYGWPHTPSWTVPELQANQLLGPYGTAIRAPEVVPPGVTVTDQYGAGFSGALAQFFGHSFLWRNAPALSADLGYAPASSTGGERRQLDIRWLTVHPKDPETVFAVTNDGLFRSTDGGYSWVREFDRPLADHRTSFHVAIHPEDHDIRFLCTKHGLFVTKDNGETYSKVEDSIISRIPCNYVTFHPDRPREVWVGAVFGVWVSKNFGETFDLEFYRRIPGQMQIRRVSFDPKNSDNILLGAEEIAFLSRDGGETFRGVGGLTFTSQDLVNVLFGEEPGSLIVASKRDVWRSNDWGESWQSVYFGNVGFFVKWAFFPRGASGPLWVLSKGELLALREKGGTPGMNEAKAEALRELFEREPSLSATMMRALRVHDAVRPALNRERRKSRWSHLAPKLQVVGTYRDMRPNFLGRGRFYGTVQGDERLPRAFSTSGRFEDWHMELWGNWDLSSVIFDQQVLPKGEIFRQNEKLARTLREDIQMVYAERRRIQIKQIVSPSTSARKRLLRKMRVEELTELLDITTRGWFSRYVKGEADEIEGSD